MRMHDGEVEIDDVRVRQLLAAQMPQFTDLTLTAVEPWGTDNGIWRLGDDLVVRLPRIGWAQEQALVESTWLPVLAPHLPVEVPQPVALGEPAFGYPFKWAVHRWIAGRGAALSHMIDPLAFAADLAAVVAALQRVPTTGAPTARGRARPLSEYDESTRKAIEAASHLIDGDSATAIWEDAMAAEPYGGSPVWVHGDLEGNCLEREGRLCGLVDWGSVCVGDPAVDVQVIWSPLFTDDSRKLFLSVLGVDDATIARSKGAAINQACAALPYYLHTYPLIVQRSWHKLAAIGVTALHQAKP
jgi:aminoglycoside phosphotransferase (APT) family kinase protein